MVAYTQGMLPTIEKPGLDILRRKKRGRAVGEIIRGFEPKTELGSLAVWFSILDEDSRISFGGHEDACEEVEPTILQSIETAEQKGPVPPRKTSALIYVDNDGRPIAFRKNRGKKTILLLRNTPLLPEIPLGTIITPRTGFTGGRPYLGSTVRLVRTPNPQLVIEQLDTPYAAQIVRPTTFSISPDLVASTHYDPSREIRFELEPYAQDLARISFASIIKRIDALAADAKI